MILRFVVFILLAAVLLGALILLLQRRLLYFPDVVLPSPTGLSTAGLSFWPGPGEAYRGIIGSSEVVDGRGTVVVFHGNAGAAWQRSYYVDALESLGYRVVLAEYPGYGGRSGSPSEHALVDDGIATVQQVYQRYGAPVFLWGESLGSGVAAAVAGRITVPVEAIILLTPWDSLPGLAQSLYPFLPVRYLMRDRYDSIANLREFSGNIAVVVAARDEIIPGQHSMALYDALAGPKKLWRFEGAGHNSWPVSPGERWWAEVMAFAAGADR